MVYGMRFMKGVGGGNHRSNTISFAENFKSLSRKRRLGKVDTLLLH